MVALNIINSADIETYLHKYCGENTLLRVCVVSALENVIKKMPECMETVSSLPGDAPQWLVDKWDEQKVWHRFNDKKNIRLAGRVYDVVIWLDSAIENDMDWIRNVDSKGRPKKLLQISTWDQLNDVMRKDERHIKKKKQTAAKQKLLHGDLTKGFEKIMTFDNGYYIIRLKSEEALDIEGAYLEHCIGDGDYDYCLGGNVTEFYSLRDSQNLPCLSMCVEKEPYKRLSQVSGHRNSYPKSKFIPYIATFCDSAFINMSDAFRFYEGYQYIQDRD